MLGSGYVDLFLVLQGQDSDQSTRTGTSNIKAIPDFANLSRDGVTDDQKPLIARHPKHANLTIAGGGSYTHAKDLPYIGRLVLEVVHNIDSQHRWDDPSLSTCFENQPMLKATTEFKDLDLAASKIDGVQHWKLDRSDFYI